MTTKFVITYSRGNSPFWRRYPCEAFDTFKDADYFRLHGLIIKSYYRDTDQTRVEEIYV